MGDGDTLLPWLPNPRPRQASRLSQRVEGGQSPRKAAHEEGPPPAVAIGTESPEPPGPVTDSRSPTWELTGGLETPYPTQAKQ